MADHCVAAGPEKLWVPDPTSNTASPRPAAPGKSAMAAGVANKGSYSKTEMNKLIAETNTSSSLAIYHTFATYAAEQLPSI